jgi:hypothetical protein
MRFLFDLVDQVGKTAPFLQLEDDILKREQVVLLKIRVLHELKFFLR